jgi:hypothetical protein
MLFELRMRSWCSVVLASRGGCETNYFETHISVVALVLHAFTSSMVNHAGNLWLKLVFIET